MGTHRMVCGRT